MSMLVLPGRLSAAHARLPGQRQQQQMRARRPVCRAAVGEEPQPAPPVEAASSSNPNQSSVPSPSSSSSSSSSNGGGLYGLMAALAAAGAAETAYLTAAKLLDAAVACPTSGCDTVLSSPYGQLFGLPLPLFGAATYGAVAVAALLAQQAASQGRRVPGWLSTGLAAGVAVLGTTSAVLMYILATRLGGESCVWCYASAGLSGSLLVALVASMDRRAMADAAGPGLGATAAAALLLAVAGFGPGGGISASSAELELAYAQPAVTTASSPQALDLAARLRAAGARMYGAFWCSHCYDQKQEFGAAAMADFPYVECFPDGWRKGVKIADACEAAGVKAFPTWVIGGVTTEGQLELTALQALLDQAAAADGAAGQAAAAVAAGQ